MTADDLRRWLTIADYLCAVWPGSRTNRKVQWAADADDWRKRGPANDWAACWRSRVDSSAWGQP